MRFEPLKDKLLPKARALMAAGATKAVAARTVGVHRDTLSRWIREERADLSASDNGAATAPPATTGEGPAARAGGILPAGPADGGATPSAPLPHTGVSPSAPASCGSPDEVAAPPVLAPPAPAPPAPAPPALAPFVRHRPLLRRRSPAGLERLTRRLEERLEELVGKSEEAPNDPKWEDRMLKLCKVLEFVRSADDDLTPLLAAMQKFAAFCVRTLPEAEMAPVRKAVRLFLDHLKREHS